ncbi:MAG: HD domain-containing protein [Clostridia bacterium]|nr:HD domain-containing protein [Clostridia bacterium]
MRKENEFNIWNSYNASESELLKDVSMELAVLKSLDVFTSAHVQGVAKKVGAMCKKMKYSYDDTKECVIAAYLHDIGKIKIPPSILQKDDSLSPEEYEIIKKHTVYGYELCMEYKAFKQYASSVRAHHENLDGTGYPDGLKEDEIPEMAKLLKVADVYDALVQKRQYKDVTKSSEALRMMSNDVKNGKMSRYYFEVLVLVILDELYEKNTAYELTILKYQNELAVLRELEKIYKEIYDKGLNSKLEKKLKKFELAPGYDMSTNASMILNKQKLLDRDKAMYESIQEEIKEIKGLKKYKMND